MDLNEIADEIAGQADDFLAGADNRREARAGIDELINADYPQLSPAERQKVAAAVMVILDEEGFFDSSSGRGRSATQDEAENGE